MKLNYGSKSLVVRYLQQKLKETYNSNILITGDYYKHFEMNYGLSHHIAKYLDYTYPILDPTTLTEYKNKQGDTIRPLKKCISITNYFLSDNKGNRLTFNPNYLKKSEDNVETPYFYYIPYIVDGSGNIIEQPEGNKLYNNIYNDYMKVVNLRDDETQLSTIQPLYPSFVVQNDLPLFVSRNSDGTYNINTNTIYRLESWNIQKDICEIDDFVASYLLGKTITPNSSMEDIYYAQKLIYNGQDIEQKRKGVWCLPGDEGTFNDMTCAIISYQQSKVNKLNTTPLFVTGYFDIFTEASILKDIGLGGVENGIHGL